MAKLESEEWLVSNLYDFEDDERGNLCIVKSDTNSPLDITKETLPHNSMTKYLLKRLKDKKLI